jgi:fumarylacetoacetase
MIAGINETHEPALRSWVASANDGVTDFPIQNLPYGIFRRRGAGGDRPRVGVAIGDHILDLAHVEHLHLLDRLSPALRAAAQAPTLNALAALDPAELSRLRRRLIEILRADNRHPDPLVVTPMAEAELLLPIDCGDYSDFYASVYHATNVGRMFRPDNPLLPNYKHVPIAYHGRSSSLVASGAPVGRPSGQIRRGDDPPVYAPTEKLDYEMEVGFVVGRGNVLGEPIPIGGAEDHVFGLCLVNDWSARDIQAWEYQPLGPFLSKSFTTTISPWVVTLEALAPYRCRAFDRPAEDPAPLPYLRSSENDARGGFDLTVEVYMRSARMRDAGMAPMRVSRGSLRDMYWTMAQMVAHQTSNGCNLRAGDLLASGTVSGPSPGSEGCLLERTRGGASVELPTGETRRFLADGDEVILRGFCELAGLARIGFGVCAGTVFGRSSPTPG